MFAPNRRKMMFHLVDLKVEECQEIHSLIVNNGGRVVNYQEDAVMVLANRYHSEINRLFHINYVRDCVSKGCILDMLPYMLGDEKYMCLVSLYLYGKNSCYVGCSDASIQTCHTSADDNVFGKNCVSSSRLAIGSDNEVPDIRSQSQESPSRLHDHTPDLISKNFMTSPPDIKPSASLIHQISTRSTRHKNKRPNSPMSDAETVVIDTFQNVKKTAQTNYANTNPPPDQYQSFVDIPSPSIQIRSHANRKNTCKDNMSTGVTIIDDSSDESVDEQVSREKQFSPEQDNRSIISRTKSIVRSIRRVPARKKLKPAEDKSTAIDSDVDMKVDDPAEDQCLNPVAISSWVSKTKRLQDINWSPRVRLRDINITAPTIQIKKEIQHGNSETLPFNAKSKSSKPVNTVFPSPLKLSLARKGSTDLEDLSDSATDTEKPSTSKAPRVSKASKKSAVAKAKSTKASKNVKMHISSSDETDFEIDDDWSGAAEKVEPQVVKPVKKEDDNPKRTITRNIAPWEQKQMIKFLIDTRQIHLAKGNAVWAQMIAGGKLKHRTVHSLNNNFRRSILPNIKMFPMDEKYRDKFLSLE